MTPFNNLVSKIEFDFDEKFMPKKEEFWKNPLLDKIALNHFKDIKSFLRLVSTQVRNETIEECVESLEGMKEDLSGVTVVRDTYNAGFVEGKIDAFVKGKSAIEGLMIKDI